MNTKIKRIVSLILAMAMAFCLCTEAFADSTLTATYSYYDSSNTIYEVVDNNSPIRSGSSEDDSILCRVNAGALIVSTGTVVTIRLTKWAKVLMSNGTTGYIYIDHVREHRCHPQEIRFGSGNDEIVFSACECGRTTIKAWNQTMFGKAKTAAGAVVGTVGAAGVAGALMETTARSSILVSTAQGVVGTPVWPVVVGFGGILLVCAGINLAVNGFNTRKLKEIDMAALIAKSAYYCGTDSVHLVNFSGGQLINAMSNNKSCVDNAVAYMYGYCGGYVWVNSSDTAKSIATYAGGSTREVTINGYSGYAFVDRNGNSTGGVVLYGGSAPC